MTLNLCSKDLSRRLSAQIDNPSKDKCLVVRVVLCFKGNLAFPTLSNLSSRFSLIFLTVISCLPLHLSRPPTSWKAEDFGNNTRKGEMWLSVYVQLLVSFSLMYETYGREKFHFAMNVEKLDLVGLSAFDTHFKWQLWMWCEYWYRMRCLYALGSTS